jgi:pimeloyl-ACP methyl ester carboxylesterase
MASITTSDGVRLDYTESGDPTGMPVVLIAGFRAAATSWLYQVPALVEAGYRVLALDMRGHGTSEGRVSGRGEADLSVENALGAIGS